ncbi:MAG TPA: hypothetical protein VFE32_14435 [Puia sp.]|jgi:hypothetical protein|nr:hypothetical protein [Puia sp.]
MATKILSVIQLWLCLGFSLPSHATVSLPNISALRGYTYTSGNEFVYVQGYSAIDDGGQGFFGWDPANSQSDNDGTVIQVGSTSGRWVRVFTGAMSVKWFGAKGDSTTDDQPSISHALQAALNAGTDLFLPGAIYKLASYGSPGSSQIFSPFPASPSSPYRIRIFGEQQTILRSALYPAAGSSNTFFFFNGAYIHCTIENIFFQNTHPLPAGSPSPIGQTNAIYLFGGPSVNNKGFTIRGCNFAGFSTAITLNGSQDTHIERCSFNAPLGRDNAQGTNMQPAVYIWAISNSNGEVINPTIVNCNANGYSGSGPISSSTASHMPMDGFIYGSPEGGLFTGNVIKNMGEELIYIQPYLDSPSTRPVVISNNLLDCGVPPGSVQNANTGIRSEAKNSVISGNTLTNVTQGIWEYAYLTWDYQFRRWQIQDNVLQFTTNSSMSLQTGIYVQGFANNLRAQYPTIINNTILADSVTLNGSDLNILNINDADSAVVTGNTLILGLVNRAGHVVNFSAMTSSYNTYYKDNLIRGRVDAMYVIGTSSPSSTYTDWDNFSDQLVTQVTSNVTLTAANATVIGNASAGSFVITLPSPSDATVTARGQGKKYVFRNITSGSSNTMTVTTPSGLIIGPSTGMSLVIGSGTTVSLQTDGSNWYVL